MRFYCLRITAPTCLTFVIPEAQYLTKYSESSIAPLVSIVYTVRRRLSLHTLKAFFCEGFSLLAFFNFSYSNIFIGGFTFRKCAT